MAIELVYTSIPRGIKQGSSGFCTAAYTRGLGPNVIMQLEGLSGYQPIFPHYDANADKNPVAFSHYICSVAGNKIHVLSRTCFCGVDYTKRSNKLAHHIVPDAGEIKAQKVGPNGIFHSPDTFLAAWTGDPKLYDMPKVLPRIDLPLHTAEVWKSYTGDAGWAGVLAQHSLDNPGKPAFIVFDPLVHTDLLSLVDEAIQLIPEQKRWDLTFNTYLTTLPAGVQCMWRFCIPGSGILKSARLMQGSLILDLTKPMPTAPEGPLQEIARTGILPEAPSITVSEPESVSQDVHENVQDDTPESTSSENIGNPLKKLKISAIPQQQNHYVPPRFRPVPVRCSGPAPVQEQKSNILVFVLCGIICLLLVIAGVFAFLFIQKNKMPMEYSHIEVTSVFPKSASRKPSQPAPQKAQPAKISQSAKPSQTAPKEAQPSAKEVQPAKISQPAPKEAQPAPQKTQPVPKEAQFAKTSQQPEPVVIDEKKSGNFVICKIPVKINEEIQRVLVFHKEHKFIDREVKDGKVAITVRRLGPGKKINHTFTLDKKKDSVTIRSETDAQGFSVVAIKTDKSVVFALEDNADWKKYVFQDKEGDPRRAKLSQDNKWIIEDLECSENTGDYIKTCKWFVVISPEEKNMEAEMKETTLEFPVDFSNELNEALEKPKKQADAGENLKKKAKEIKEKIQGYFNPNKDSKGQKIKDFSPVVSYLKDCFKGKIPKEVSEELKQSCKAPDKIEDQLKDLRSVLDAMKDLEKAAGITGVVEKILSDDYEDLKKHIKAKKSDYDSNQRNKVERVYEPFFKRCRLELRSSSGGVLRRWEIKPESPK